MVRDEDGIRLVEEEEEEKESPLKQGMGVVGGVVVSTGQENVPGTEEKVEEVEVEEAGPLVRVIVARHKSTSTSPQTVANGASWTTSDWWSSEVVVLKLIARREESPLPPPPNPFSSSRIAPPLLRSTTNADTEDDMKTSPVIR